MKKAVSNTIAGLAIAGGAEHLLNLVGFDLVKTVAGWLSFVPYVAPVVFFVAGAAGVYAGFRLWK